MTVRRSDLRYIFMRKGEITVFLALILSALTGLMGVLIKSAQAQLIRMNVEGVMDAGLYSCFGEYDRKLFDRYELLFIDSSYRGECEAGIDNVSRHLSQYLTENTDYGKTDASADWYRETVEEVTAEGYVFASDSNGDVIRHQASGYIENYGRCRYIADINANKDTVNVNPGTDFMGEWDASIAAVRAYGLPLVNPGEIVRGMVLSYDEYLKGASLNSERTGDKPSQRSLKQGNSLSRLKDISVSDDLFTEYLMQKCGCYTEYGNEQQLVCELEYIVYGKGNDRDNMRCAAERLLKLRERDNLKCLKSDAGRMSEAWEKAYEVVLFNTPLYMGTAVPDTELVRLVRDTIIYAWAYAESAMDVGCLLNKGRCPVKKGASEISLSLGELLDFRSKINGTGGRGISYKTYIGCFVTELPDTIITKRFMDIVEGNFRCFYNESFRIDGCVVYLEAEAELSSAYGYRNTIKRDHSFEVTGRNST